MDANVRWVKLTRGEISRKIKEAGIKISRNIVRKLLRKHNFVKRKMQRQISGGIYEHRDQQFQNITHYKQEFTEQDNPIISIDTKKKELLGELHRAGSVYCKDMTHIAVLPNNIIPKIDDFVASDTSLLISQDETIIYLLKTDKTINTLTYAMLIQILATLLMPNTIKNITTIGILNGLQNLSKQIFATITQLFDLYSRDNAIQVHDHDFSHLATGKIVPHGIYDIKQNKAFINIGNNNETAEFVCDSIAYWWDNHGKHDYPQAKEILVLSDAGGANSYRHHIYKLELQQLANTIKLPIRIAHYPPYSSKWNPIEHRVFPHVTKALEGLILHTEEQAAKVIGTAKTITGLSVTTNVMKKLYQKGKKWTQEAVEKIHIKYDELLGELNYKISPQLC
jgi:hypothetical protein